MRLHTNDRRISIRLSCLSFDLAASLHLDLIFHLRLIFGVFLRLRLILGVFLHLAARFGMGLLGRGRRSMVRALASLDVVAWMLVTG